MVEMMGMYTRTCVIEGLQSESGRLLNGRMAQVMAVDQSTGRVCVRMSPGDLKQAWKKLKPDNIRMCSASEVSSEQLHARGPIPSREAIGLPGFSGAWLPQNDIIYNELIAVMDLLKEGAFVMVGSTGQHRSNPLWKTAIQNMGVLLLQFKCARLVTLAMKLDAMQKGVELLFMKLDADDSLRILDEAILRRVKTRLGFVQSFFHMALVFAECIPSVAQGDLDVGLSSKGALQPLKDSGEVEPLGEQAVSLVKESRHLGKVAVDAGHLQEQAAPDTTDLVERFVLSESESDHGNDEKENILLYPYTRAPADLMKALLKGSELQHIREQMETHDCAYVLAGSGATVFVWPEQYKTVLHALEKLGIALLSSHVIVAESLLPDIEASIAALPSQKIVHVKEEGRCVLTGSPTTQVDTLPHASDERLQSIGKMSLIQSLDEGIQEIEDWKHVLLVKPTLICNARFEGVRSRRVSKAQRCTVA